MKKRILCIITVLTLMLSMCNYAYAEASCEVTFQDGSLVVTGVADFGELDYATEVTVTAYDLDGKLNYIDILPIGTDGKINFSYYNLGKSGDYTFNFDISAFNKTLTTKLENFIGSDYWIAYCSNVSQLAKDKASKELSSKLLNETKLQLSLEEYNGLTDKDGVFGVMIEDFTQDYVSQDEIRSAFYQAVALAKLREDNDVEAYYDTCVDTLGLPDGVKSNSRSVLDDVTDKARNAVVSAISSECNAYAGNTDSKERFLYHVLYTVIANADNYNDVKYVLNAYARVGLLDVAVDMDAYKYKALMNNIYCSEAEIQTAINNAKPSGGSSGGSSTSTKGSYQGTTGLGVTTGGGNSSVPAVDVKPSIQSAAMTFSDMEDAKWALEQVEKLYEKGIISGTGEDTYEPHRYVSREEFSKMLVLLGGYSLETGEIPFADVNTASWSFHYVSSAYRNGLIRGFSNDRFGPKALISREQAATMIYRMISDRVVAKENFEFDDDGLISEWAKDAVYALYGSKIINGRTSTEFVPDEFLTRAEAAVLIYNAGTNVIWKGEVE